MGRRKPYKTATEAKAYAARVQERWCRLYDVFVALPEDTKARLRPDQFKFDILPEQEPAT
jgi:hypothetical protein